MGKGRRGRRRGRSGKDIVIKAELKRAREILDNLAEDAYQKNREFTWNEIEKIKEFRRVSPRYEDRELIVNCASMVPQLKRSMPALELKKSLYEKLLKRERQNGKNELFRWRELFLQKLQKKIGQTEKEINRQGEALKVMPKLLDEAILEKALYQVPSIHERGWMIRKKLQEILARLEAHVEIVGRGENKIGYTKRAREDAKRLIAEGRPIEKVICGMAYPADLVVQRKLAEELKEKTGGKYTGPETETWLVEVEPRGIRERVIEKKINVITEAMENRVEVCEELSGQMHRPNENHAIVFYTGIHPTLAETQEIANGILPGGAKGFLNRRIDLTPREKKNLAKRYQAQLDAKYDQHGTLEEQLHRAVGTEEKRTAILTSHLPVYWLAVTPNTNEAHIIDLKKLAKHVARGRGFFTPEFVPVMQEKNIGINTRGNMLNLEYLKNAKVMRPLGEIRGANVMKLEAHKRL